MAHQALFCYSDSTPTVAAVVVPYISSGPVDGMGRKPAAEVSALFYQHRVSAFSAHGTKRCLTYSPSRNGRGHSSHS